VEPPSQCVGAIQIWTHCHILSLSAFSWAATTTPLPAAKTSITSSKTTYGSSTTVTTYYLPLLNSQQQQQVKRTMLGVLEVSDWALIDGVTMAINHSVLSPLATPSHNNATTSGVVYMLVLHFPPFNRSVNYDPSINLGLLTAHQTSSSGPNIALIVGTTVGFLVGLSFLVLAIAIFIVVRKLEKAPRSKSISLTHQFYPEDL